MPVPMRYRTGGEAPNIQYDWIDYLANVAYTRFYACASTSSTATTYFLTSKNTYDSNPMYTTDAVDIDCDFTFNVPVVIAGADAIVNLTLRHMQNANNKVVINVYHVTSGGVETSIGTFTCPTHAGAVTTIYREGMKITLSQKEFKVGEKLRLNVKNEGTLPTVNSYIYHDPNTSSTLTDSFSRTVGTDLTFDVPFKIQT